MPALTYKIKVMKGRTGGLERLNIMRSTEAERSRSVIVL